MVGLEISEPSTVCGTPIFSASPRGWCGAAPGNWKEVFVAHLGGENTSEESEYMYKFSKKSPTGPTEWTPKPEYLIALAPYLGVRW